ncbi:MAG: pcaB [Marmoricola sp.]|nr:pcaB [Marmoricola sp.]
MADLFWPGSERAHDIFTNEAFLAAMVNVEQAWLEASDPGTEVCLVDLVTGDDLASLAADAEADGNPVSGLVALLRRRSGVKGVHRGLTSQDVVDTALVLCLRRALDRITFDVERQARALVRLAAHHRTSVMPARTLTQWAVPTTFGLKAATWLQGLSAATGRLNQCRPLPAQIGGAAGTLAAPAELAGGTEAALSRATDAAQRLGLAVAPPWHTERSILTEHADALVAFADLWGRIGGDVALLSRPEIGELREGAGGSSSTMPGKANPVLSVLLRRHGLTAPGHAATLHVAAAASVDERPDGAWHTEWDALRSLARHSVVAASQAADLLEGLVVNTDRMAERVVVAASTLTAEQRSMGGAGDDASNYLGAADQLITAALERAALVWRDLA